MSDQQKGAGHHAITREAVRQFFAHVRPADGTIDAMTEEQYFAALDAAQEHQDRAVATTDVSVHGYHVPVPTGSGPTTHSAWSDPDVQRQHGMADPHHTGQWNLDTDRQYVEGELAAAHTGADRMAHLGAAAHAVEDSYSEAHVWRGDAANTGDPTAPVQSFNVFDAVPGAVHGGVRTGGFLNGHDETHDADFDRVPVDVPLGRLQHGSDRAAAAATAQALEAEYASRGESAADAQAEVHRTVAPFYRADAGGVDVNIASTPAWEAERDRRLEEHRAEDRANAARPYTPAPDQRPDQP